MCFVCVFTLVSQSNVDLVVSSCVCYSVLGVSVNFDKCEVFRRGVTFALLDRIYTLMFSRTLVSIL